MHEVLHCKFCKFLIHFQLVTWRTHSSQVLLADVRRIMHSYSISQNHLNPSCWRDEFPSGYTAADALSLLCPPESLFPDEGNGCRAQVSAGGACQMNRDKQCARAVLVNWQDFPGLCNFYGLIFLHSVCTRVVRTHFRFRLPVEYANATTASVIDNSTYN
ncbi:hypothetical protein BDP27DRAFT_1047258 [Rhodocollybia butyracea]|uniref:Uncharacterized protein n=1 Tax=Rhodocollybia butyracea TaxID=206335 RepID=A0A9P5PQD2_9AGAR|nr:hypothetical protein BDP27DRAFT_1047258 [Rhodocollybia butyracea]